ncbi:CxxC-x17-CxxC domain-containing protein [Desulfotomaculum arcticum]|uniref:CxxC-x17-CxxC domain-containing protein n=1 Tax=Desulfotruncus arcticus DSM 17038 TaxID=1121424 RepID=A0A1I2XRB0_9FIRM|nr:zinc-ribbon domain containing protein [Desulfotruncus arcticus]SFH15905.1 CxxC-x17-CxxC domain-containing protein [Desulfotomaculum arcticum] [Desulfotruncus arcticus DSM 17038]
MFQDKILTCRDCGQDFTFSVSEQEFFADKGFTNEPGRCPECRALRKQNSNRGSNYSQNRREMHSVICSNCGQETTVPFVPSQDKPVYCRDCYQKLASNRRVGSYR